MLDCWSGSHCSALVFRSCVYNECAYGIHFNKIPVYSISLNILFVNKNFSVEFSAYI